MSKHPPVYYVLCPQNQCTLIGGELVENNYLARAILVHIELDGLDSVKNAIAEFPQFKIKQVQCDCEF